MYKPKSSLESPRFCGIRTFMRLPYVNETVEADFAIVGVPFDTGQSFRTGARLGPSHIRDFSSLLRPYNGVQDIDIYEYCSGIDYGDIDVIPGNIHRTYENIELGLEPLFNADITPVILGGDHSITLGSLRAAAKKHGPLSLILFDSHTDTSEALYGEQYTHGTPFKRALEEGLISPENSVFIGMRGSMVTPNDLDDARELGFKIITMREVRELGTDEVVRQIYERVGNHKAFLSFDIDFYDPVYAPGTGTPEVGGATTVQGIEFIQKLKDINFVGFDLVEVLPAYDSGQLTAIAASNTIYEMITLIALNKRRRVQEEKEVASLESSK
ncbi:agmatinase [Oceanobacillus luteolus]|uniref:Agmatinase n=1 Tax=Oceanobacillus luteolus TaxID=1274358 RepID=A0ABW4HNS6_9BACI